MRGHIAIAIALIVACSSPPPSTTPAAAAAPSDASAPPATVPANPRPTTAAPPSAPVSAGAVPDAGLLLFFDYGWLPDLGQTVTPAAYRYDGSSGALSKLAEGASISGSVAHETASGIYVQGPNGRMDFMRWDGSRASDQEFTACQQEPGFFASWCSVSATGVGVGYGSHVGPGPGPLTGPFCPPAFIRLPGTARSTSFPPELCVQGARVSVDGKQILIFDVAREASPAAPVGGRCQPGMSRSMRPSATSSASGSCRSVACLGGCGSRRSCPGSPPGGSRPTGGPRADGKLTAAPASSISGP